MRANSVPGASALPAAGLIFTACGSGPAHSDAGGRAPKRQSCHQMFAAWQHGPGSAAGTAVNIALSDVRSAAKSNNVSLLVSALGKLGPAAGRLSAYPIPHCADPGGYWGALLDHMKAAGDSARSANGLRAITLAEPALEQVPSILTRLSSELHRTVGLSRNAFG